MDKKYTVYKVVEIASYDTKEAAIESIKKLPHTITPKYYWVADNSLVPNKKIIAGMTIGRIR